MDVVSWLLSRAYVNKTLVGMGALKGAPAMISSIVDNPDGTHDITFSWKDNSDVTHTSVLTVANGETPTITSTKIEGGHTITFATTNPSQTVSFNVMDGLEGQRGVSVIRANVDNNNYLTLELSDGNIINAGQIKTVSMVDNTLSLESANPVQNKVITRKFGEYKTAFTGTEEEWNALTSEQQNVYDIMNITNDGDVLNLGIYLEKKTAMPVASEDVANRIYLYTGTTTQDYKKGVVYQCVSDGQDPATYSWVALIDFGTASIKNSTDRVSPNNTDLVESQSVYSAINTALSSIYTPRGDITCAELTSALLISDNIGNVYETSDSGTTTALFLQGAGHPIATGSNVGIINAGQGRILFNLMANAFDLTNYQKIDLTSAVEGETTVEGALGALSTNKQAKILSASVESQTTVEGALGALSTNKAAAEDVDSLNETLTNFEESITGEVVDSEPYVLRQGLGNLADMDLVGGSLAWNQLNGIGGTKSSNGITWTSNNDGSYTVTGTASAYAAEVVGTASKRLVNHVYLIRGGVSNVSVYTNQSGNTYTYASVATVDRGQGVIFKCITSSGNDTYLGSGVENGVNPNGVKIYPQLFDLTAMFGSTIADYIYSLEQATAGAGVAWFRQYFPNAYYGYQSGKIESVNVASRKVIGKNLYIGSPSFDGYSSMSDYQVASELYNGHEVIYKSIIWNGAYKFVPVKKGVTYTFSAMVKTNGGARVDLYYDSSGTYCYRGYVPNTWTKISGTFTPSKDGEARCRAELSSDGTIYIAEYQIEIGETATNYEPYAEYSYPFDPSIQLRGIPKLVDNKLSYYGDIYNADGTVTRKYGIVDLGSLTWNYTADWNGGSSISTPTNTINSANPSNIVAVNAISARYGIVSREFLSTNPTAKALAVNESKSIIVRDSAYSDAATFKTAMSGVYLVYELATPITESANAYQNPQRAFIDGTEEFVDYGVQSATRDVSIPVGNNTTYQLNETLPPIEDYVDGALKFKVAISALGTDESGRTTASRAYTTGEFFYKDGKMYKVLASIASGATFTVGTNCQQTTLFAELKALAQ